jgi:hypothetical protein
MLHYITEKIKVTFKVMENPLFVNESVNKIVLDLKKQLLKEDYLVQQLHFSDEFLNVFARLLWRLKQLKILQSNVHSPMSYMPVWITDLDINTLKEKKVLKHKYVSTLGRYLDMDDVEHFAKISRLVDPDLEVIIPGAKKYRKKLSDREFIFNLHNKEKLRKFFKKLNSRFFHYACKACVDPIWRRIPLWMYLDEDRWSECERLATNPDSVVPLSDFLNNFVTFALYLVGGIGVLDFSKMTQPRAVVKSFLGKRSAASTPQEVDWSEHDPFGNSHKKQAKLFREFVSDDISQTSEETDISEEWSNTGVCSVSERENRDCAGPVMWQSDSSADSFDTLVATLNQDGDVCNSLSTEDSLGWEFDLDDLM